MTTKEIEDRIKKAEEKREILKERILVYPLALIIENKLISNIDALNKEIWKLHKDKIKSIIQNKEYIFDLSEYNNKSLISITALDKEGDVICFPVDEIMEVRNGYLYCSSFDYGIVYYDLKEKSYVHNYRQNQTKLEIIGFIDIITED